MTTCAACKTEFRPRRSTARYCGARCRKAASRGVTGGRLHSFLSVTGHTPSPRPSKPSHVTLTSPVRRNSNALIGASSQMRSGQTCFGSGCPTGPCL